MLLFSQPKSFDQFGFEENQIKLFETKEKQRERQVNIELGFPETFYDLLSDFQIEPI